MAGGIYPRRHFTCWGIYTDVEPLSLMEKTLYAVDELTGFITAYALARPSKSIMDLKPKSVHKKWKQKHFAAGVDRTIIEKGAQGCKPKPAEFVQSVLNGQMLSVNPLQNYI